MAKCRIQNLKPPCGYRLDGITDIRLLDLDDFAGFIFRGDGAYPNSYVSTLLRRGDYADFETPDTAKYSSTLQNGEYTHTVETFIGDLSAGLIEQLHLATKRRYIATFKGVNGRYFVFGYDAGATVTYVNQTAEGLGSLVTITAQSIYPLFEWNGADITCEWGDFTNMWSYAAVTTSCTWRDFINTWVTTICLNDFGSDFSADFNCESPQPPRCTWQHFVNVWKSLQINCLNDFGNDFGEDFTCILPDQLERSVWGDFLNIWEQLQLQVAWGDFINIWKESARTCVDDFGDDFGDDFRCAAPAGPFLEVTPGTIWLPAEPEYPEQSEIRSNVEWSIN